jgi:hypothetical protein
MPQPTANPSMMRQTVPYHVAGADHRGEALAGGLATMVPTTV